MSDTIHQRSRLTDDENALFAKWRLRYGDGTPFVSDGAVDPAQFARCSTKLVFVLKEANDEGGGTWDLREYLYGGARGYTWNAVTRWVEGVLQLPRVLSWRELKAQPDNTRRQRALRNIVAVNLKKKPGGSAANERKISEAARRDRDLISAQLSLYEPDLLICCGDAVATALAEDVYALPGNGWTTTARGVWFRRLNGTLLVSYYHPAARFPGPLLHYGLIDALQDLRKRANEMSMHDD